MFKILIYEIYEEIRKLENCNIFSLIKNLMYDTFSGQDLRWEQQKYANKGVIVNVKYMFSKEGIKTLAIFPNSPENSWWFYYWNLPTTENIKLLWSMFKYDLIVAYGMYILCTIWITFFILIGLIGKERNRLIAVIFLLVLTVILYLAIYTIMHFSTLGPLLKYSGRLESTLHNDFTIYSTPKPIKCNTYHMVLEVGDKRIDRIMNKINESITWELSPERKKLLKPQTSFFEKKKKPDTCIKWAELKNYSLPKFNAIIKNGFQSLSHLSYNPRFGPKKYNYVDVFKSITLHRKYSNEMLIRMIEAEKITIKLNNLATVNATLWLVWRAYALDASIISNYKTTILIVTMLGSILCTLLSMPSTYAKWSSKRLELWTPLKMRQELKRDRLIEFSDAIEAVKEFGGPGLLEIKSLEPYRFTKKLYPLTSFKDAISWQFWKKNFNAAIYTRVNTTTMWVVSCAGILLTESRSTHAKLIIIFFLSIWGAWYYCIRNLEGSYITNTGEKVSLAAINTFLFFFASLSSGKSFYLFNNSKYFILSLIIVFAATYIVSNYQKKHAITFIKNLMFIGGVTALLHNALIVYIGPENSEHPVHDALAGNVDLLAAIWLWSYISLWYRFYAQKQIKSYPFYVLILLPTAYLIYNEITIFCNISQNRWLLAFIGLESLRILYFFEKSTKVWIFADGKPVLLKKKLSSSQSRYILKFLTMLYLLWISYAVLSCDQKYSSLLSFHIFFVTLSFFILLIIKTISTYAAKGGVENIYGAITSLRYAKRFYNTTTLLFLITILFFFIYFIYFIF